MTKRKCVEADKRTVYEAMRDNDLEWAAQLHGELCRKLGTRANYAECTTKQQTVYWHRHIN